MDISQEKQIKKLLQDMAVMESNDASKIERMSKYVKEPNKNIYVCRHPSEIVHYYHTHDFFEINYTFEGDCINQIEGESLYMKTGDFLMLHPGTFHTVYADAQSKVLNILIQPAFLQQTFSNVHTIEDSALSFFINKISSKSYYKYVMCEGELVRKEITSLIEEEAADDVNSNIMQEALVSMLICKLLRTEKHGVISDMRFSSSNTMIDMLQYIYDNYNKVTLSELSQEFGYTPAHICRMLSSQTGKTFGNILIGIRMEKAATYLRDTKYKVYEIAQLLGYESNEHFHRLFKSKFGITPLQFRSAGNKNMIEAQINLLN